MPSISLPTELWRRIIQEATTPPGGLVTSWHYTPSEKLFRGWEDIDFEDHEIQTKLSIVLVCKQWHTLGIEFLYQWIRLKSRSRATALAEVFREANSVTANEPESTRAFGWWVKRVDGAAALFEAEGMEDLYAFLEQCFQVEILIHLPPYAASILEHHDRGLTYLQAGKFHHSLRHLRLRLCKASDVPAPMTLSSLTSITLVFVSNDDIVPDWQLPSLRFVKLFQLHESAIRALEPFLVRQGPSLTGIQFRSYSRLESIDWILTYTPALQSLVLDENDLMALGRTELSFPSITHVGIQLSDPDSTEEAYDISSITSDFKHLLTNRTLPGLKTIRLLAVEKDTTLEEKWAELFTLCKSHNVTLGRT